jgi:flagellar FliL protein
MAKSAKPAPAETEAPAKPKSKKILLVIIGVLILGAIGGAGWWFFMRDKHTDEPKAAVVEIPTFMVLEPFTVNLQHEESDQFLQIGITLKVSSMEMADKLRQRLPEVRSRLLFLLSSKRASELMPIEGKKKLAQEIIVETNTILGLRTAPQQNVAAESNVTPNADTASGVEVATASGVEVATASGVDAVTADAAASAPVASDSASNNGVLDVLFTAFIIQ